MQTGSHQSRNSLFRIRIRRGFQSGIAIPLFFLSFICKVDASPIDQSVEHYLPQELPAGFSYMKQPAFYGTSEQKSGNGTIFDYIDGGGIVYLDHGFREVTHLVLNDQKKTTITLDIFNMGSSENALAAFNDEAICPKGYVEINIGTTCKSYQFSPEYLLYFVKNKYLVYLIVSDDAVTETLRQFATSIYQALR